MPPYVLAVDYTDDPNPRPWEGSYLYDTYGEAVQAGEYSTRSSMDYAYTVVDVGGLGLFYIPLHRPIEALRELRRLIVEELAGEAPPDDEDPKNVVRLLQAAGARLLTAAEELES